MSGSKRKKFGFTTLRRNSGHRTVSLSNGFTIVELLVVIVVIGILAAITIISYQGVQKKAYVATIKSDLGNASKKLELYKLDNSDLYPINAQASDIKSSSGINFSIYNQSGNSYCLQASNKSFNLVYHIDSTTNQPLYGKCPHYTFTMSAYSTNGRYVSSIIQTADGGYAVTGGTSGTSSDMFIAKYNSSGVQTWENVLNGTGNGNDWGRSIIQTSDGGYVVTGETYSGSNFDAYIIKYNAGGTYVDSTVIGTVNDQYPYSIIETNDHYFAITGRSVIANSSEYRMFVAKINLDNGGVFWSHTGDAGYNSYGSSVIQSSDGNSIIIVGSADTGEANPYNGFVIKYDYATGTGSWSQALGGSGNDYIEHITQLSDGNYVVVGTSDSYAYGNSDVFIYKLNSANASEMWHMTLGGAHNDWARSIISTSDGGFAFAGTFGIDDGNGNLSSYETYFSKGDTNGNIVWNDEGVVWGGAKSDFGYSIKQDGANYYIMGETNSYSGNDTFQMFRVTCDSSGTITASGTLGG